MRLRKNPPVDTEIHLLVLVVSDNVHMRIRDEWLRRGAIQPEFHGPSVVATMQELLRQGHRVFITWHPAVVRYVQFLVGQNHIEEKNVHMFTPEFKGKPNLKRMRLTQDNYAAFTSDWPFGFLNEEHNLIMGDLSEYLTAYGTDTNFWLPHKQVEIDDDDLLQHLPETVKFARLMGY